MAEVRRDKAYAEVQDSFGRLLVSIGVDPVPADTSLDDIHGLAEAIRRNMALWRQRDLRRFLDLPAVENASASAADPLAAEALFAPTPPDAEAGLTAAKTPEHSSAPLPAEAEMSRNRDRSDENADKTPTEPVAAGLQSAPAEEGAGRNEALGDEGDLAAETQPADLAPAPAAAVHDVKTAAAPTVQGRTRFARLHLRKAPSLKAVILAKAKEKGEAVEVLEDLGDWLHVAYKGMRGYMFARYVDTPESTLPGRTLTQRVHLRNAPSLSAPIIGKVHDKGTKIDIIEETGGWLHVEHNGHRGYMFARYVQKAE